MNKYHLATFAAAATLALPTQAARPLDTDDAGVIAPRVCEVEGARLLAKAGDVKAGESSAALACGIGFGSQIGAAYAQARSGDGKARGLSLLGKSELWAGSGEGAPALSLGWSLGWGKADGASWEHETTEARLLGTQPLGSVILHANLGHARDHTAKSRATLWGVAVEHEPLPAGPVAWAPLAELFGDDHGDRWVNAGVRFTVLPEKLFVDFSYARQLVADKARVLNAGFKLAF